MTYRSVAPIPKRKRVLNNNKKAISSLFRQSNLDNVFYFDKESTDQIIKDKRIIIKKNDICARKIFLQTYPNNHVFLITDGTQIIAWCRFKRHAFETEDSFSRKIQLKKFKRNNVQIIPFSLTNGYSGKLSENVSVDTLLDFMH